MKNSGNKAGEFLVAAPSGMTELVRGNEQRLEALFMPLVRTESVALDCSNIERIDAAGIAALIDLYTHARKAGHNFALCNVPHRIEEILSLVGLDHILVSHDRVSRDLAAHDVAPSPLAQACCDGRAA